MISAARWMGKLSKRASLPFLNRLSPSVEAEPTASELAGYAHAQSVAREAAVEVASLVREGWSETQAADLLGTYLRDKGVRAFFHHPFAWFGSRTRFQGIRSYTAYQPSDKRLKMGDVFILDVAPIVDGFVCDIGYTASLGENAELAKAKAWLHEIRRDLPGLFQKAETGGEVWAEVDRRLKAAGFDNIHQRYPFEVLGHRVPRVTGAAAPLKLLHFGWQSYWSLASRGLFGQLLARFHEGGLLGLWAVEPHIGGAGFGAKFEEILVVDKNGAHWLQEALI